MHAPVRVHAEHVDQFVAPFGIGILQLFHHVADGNIGHEGYLMTDKGYRPHAPIAIQIGPMKVETRVVKGVEAQDADGLGLTRGGVDALGQVTARKNAQEGGLARPVGPNQQTARTRRQAKVQVL